MCKHSNGMLIELMDASHSREVSNGVLEEEGINEMGWITGYEYKCYGCDKVFKFKAFPKQKWLQKIHEQLANE